MSRFLGRLLVVGVALSAVGWLATPAGAAPGPAASEATCALTGYTAADDAALGRMQRSLAAQTAFSTAGTPIQPHGTWTVPAGRPALVVIDHEQVGPAYTERLTVAGQRTWSSSGTAAGQRWVSGTLPSAQSWTRRTGIAVDVADCHVAITMTSSRGPLSTQLGRIGGVLLVVGGFLLVLVGRGRSRTISTLAALPFGLLAGAGVSALLYESGRLGVYGHAVYVAPIIGMILALVLPWTRRRAASPPEESLSAVFRRLGPEAKPRFDDRLAASWGGNVPPAYGGSGAPVPAQTRSPEEAAAPVPAVVHARADGSTEGTTDRATGGTPARGAIVGEPGGLSVASPARALAARSGRAPRIITAVVAGVLCATAGAVIVLARPTTASAADGTLSPDSAQLLVARTWDAVLAGDTSHVAAPMRQMATGLRATPHLVNGPLRAITVGIPRTRGMFVATGQAAVTGGTEYVYFRYWHDPGNAGWTVVDVRFGAAAADIPRPAFGPNGSLAAAGGTDAATYAREYIAYLRQVGRARTVVSSPTFATPTSSRSFVRSSAPEVGVRGRTYVTWAYTDAGPATEGVVPVAGGSTLVTFTIAAHLTVYDAIRPVAVGCTTISLRYGADRHPYRRLDIDEQIPVTVTVPPGGKPTIADTLQTNESFRGTPC
jgi:hypothetical protein